MATIAEKYFRETGETVQQACKDMHEHGFTIAKAARVIGFFSSNDLRLFFSRRAIPCPWPKTQAPERKRGKPPIKVTRDEMVLYAELRRLGLSAESAAAEVGRSVHSINHAIRARGKDIELPTGRTGTMKPAHLRKRVAITGRVVERGEHANAS